MNLFYLILYIFIGIIVLLCGISCIIYLCYICGDVFPKKKINLPARNVYKPEEQQLLNSPQQSGGNQPVELQHVRTRIQTFEQKNNQDASSYLTQVEHKQVSAHAIDPRIFALRPSGDLPANTNVTNTNVTNTNVTNTNVTDKRANADNKLTVTVKPIIHSHPSSEHNLLVVKSKVRPPPPPNSVSVSPTNSLTVVKPRAPPPPAPKTQATMVPPLSATYNYLSDS